MRVQTSYAGLVFGAFLLDILLDAIHELKTLLYTVYLILYCCTACDFTYTVVRVHDCTARSYQSIS